MSSHQPDNNPTGPSKEILCTLQNLSRQLDMNSASNTPAVRRELTRLVEEGLITPPTDVSGPARQLKELAAQGGWQDRLNEFDGIDPVIVLKLLGEEVKTVAPLGSFDSLTVPELSRFISGEISKTVPINALTKIGRPKNKGA